MKFIDLFSGIGGFRLGMEQADHECVAFCEIDKFARESYKAIHDTEGEMEFHDITAITDESIRSIGSVDVICGGFPCQAFSIAGKRRGFEDTRGTLFFEIARFASILRPRLLFLENVKGLLNHEGGATFETILRALDELGYDVEWQVLNSKNFGVPQNRERVFIIGHLRGECGRKVFPFGETSKKNDDRGIYTGTLTTRYPYNQREGTYIKTSREKEIAIPVLTPDRLEKRQNGRRFKEDGEEMFTLTAQDKHGVIVAAELDGSHEQNNRVYDTRGISPTLCTMQGGGQEPKIIQKARGNNKGGVHDIAPTITSNSYHENNLISMSTNNFRIRKLTPRECWRLQGFPDWAFDRAEKVNSNSQLYKQAGNSVTVNVIYEIAKRL